MFSATANTAAQQRQARRRCHADSPVAGNSWQCTSRRCESQPPCPLRSSVPEAVPDRCGVRVEPVAAERRAGRDRAAGRSGRSSRPGGRSGASGRCSPQRAVRLHGGKRGRAALMDGGACLSLPRPSTERRHACAPPVPKAPRAPPERWRACVQVRDGPSMGRRVQRAASTSPEPPNEAEATSILGCVAPPGRAAGDLRTLAVGQR